MRGDYGMDDIEWLLATSGRSSRVAIEAWGERFEIPIARFDNREDRTSFLRADPSEWPADQVADIHRHLSEALSSLQTG